MINFGPTFIWTAFNLLVLYFLMRRVLFKPVTQFMNNRTKSIRVMIETAEEKKMESMELKKEYERLLKNARGEADRIIEAARMKSNKEYEDTIHAAKKDAEDIIQKAREEIEYEKVLAFKALRNEVVELALLAASKVIEENMNNEANRVIVSTFIDKVGAV